MLKHLFDEKKAAQVAAYLLFRAGHPLTVLKLMKLMYLAERRSFEKFGEPMIGDLLVSMDHGPVLSRTYNHMNGNRPSAEKGWEYWIADRAGHDLALRNPKALRDPEKDLLQLSDADLGILEEVWKKFGRMDQWKLRDYTHRYCPEWKDPEGSMIPMTPEHFLAALKLTSRQRKEALGKMRAQNRINAAFESVKE
jgi:uncharacterized phage-associated protein